MCEISGLWEGSYIIVTWQCLLLCLGLLTSQNLQVLKYFRYSFVGKCIYHFVNIFLWKIWLWRHVAPVCVLSYLVTTLLTAVKIFYSNLGPNSSFSMNSIIWQWSKYGSYFIRLSRVGHIVSSRNIPGQTFYTGAVPIIFK